MKKIAIIRIRGLVGVRKKIKDTLNMLRLRKKFVCVILDETKENIGMIKLVQTFVAYGEIDKETLKALIMSRGRFPGDKIVNFAGSNLENVLNDFLDGKKKLKDIGIKPFFRLHPPKGGFKKSTKLLWPNGVLGKNPKINELIIKML